MHVSPSRVRAAWNPDTALALRDASFFFAPDGGTLATIIRLLDRDNDTVVRIPAPRCCPAFPWP